MGACACDAYAYLEIVYVSMSKSTRKSCVVAGLQVQN